MRLLSLIALVPSLAFAQGWQIRGGGATADPLTLTSTVTASGFVSTAASGANAVSVSTNGARVDFGAGASDYASSNGTTITFAGAVTTGIFNASSVATTGAAAAAHYRIIGASALETCVAGAEGRFRWVTGTGGTSGGGMTKICLCQSDGAGSPTYAWQRINDPSLTLAASIGTTTTCP
jgi:hypothetical protein